MGFCGRKAGVAMNIDHGQGCNKTSSCVIGPTASAKLGELPVTWQEVSFGPCDVAEAETALSKHMWTQIDHYCL